MRSFSFPLFAIATLSLAAACIARSQVTRFFYFILIVSLATYLTQTTTGHAVVDYFLGSIYAGLILFALDYAILTNVQEELRLAGQKEPVTEGSFFSRFKWGFRLWFSQRGINWTHEPKGLRPRVSPDTTRKQFVLKALLDVGWHIFLLDLCSTYNRTNPAYFPGGPSLADRPFFFRVLDLYSWFFTSYGQMCVFHATQSLVSVGLGFSKPTDWVHPFGFVTDAYLLRHFWGRVWHQFVRRCSSTPGKYLSHNVFRIRRNSKLNLYIQVFVSFFLSAFLHVVADYLVDRKLFAGGSLFFFTAQPFAIMFEEAVITLGKRIGFKSSAWKLVGFVWVTLWFMYMFPPWFDFMVQRGNFMEDGLNLPVSIISGITKGQWIVKGTGSGRPTELAF